jgi:uncharacterized membrane protein YhaH (DUF805 family)
MERVMNWYLSVLKNYAQFSGRARRTEYWMFVLVNLIISVGITVVEAMIGSPGYIGILYNLAVLIPSLAVGARRLHDTGRTGWWMLICLVPIIGIIVLFVFMAFDGDANENQYGINPKQVA